MNLREKLTTPFDGLRTETLNELEKIADDHAIGFAVWLDKNENNYKGLLLEELLEQYKQIYTTPQAIIDVVLKNPPYEPI